MARRKFGGNKEPRLSRKATFSPMERRAAPGKLKTLKDARAELQVLEAELSGMGKEKIAILNTMLERKKVKRNLSTLVTQSLMLTENLKAAVDGKDPKHNISAHEEALLFIEISIVLNVIKEAKVKGII